MTTATTKRCTPSTRPPASSVSTRSTCCCCIRAPTQFDKTIEAYRALEQLLADGRVRAIGVSNFMPEHLRVLLDRASVVPAVNQVEVHPYFTQPDVQSANRERRF